MPTDAHYINFHVVDIHRNFTNCLCSICVEENLMLTADLTCNKNTKAKKTRIISSNRYNSSDANNESKATVYSKDQL